MTAVVSLAFVSQSFALPQGGQVVGGQASIATSGSQTTITQSTQHGIINWQSFDIAHGEAVHFQQPSASSVTLNRVTGGQGASQILGNLTANGTVMLVNPQGTFIGPNANVNAGSFLATTSDIADDRFMAGDYRFDKPGSPDAAIINNGSITVAEAGLAALVAPNVVNNGLIQARLGKVQLASGDTFTLDLYGDGLFALEAGPTITSQLVSNGGIIAAEGGKVLMTAAAAGEVVNSLINMDGIVSATSIGEQNGEIVIFAEGSNAVLGNDASKKNQKSGSSTVLVSGVLDASGRGEGGRGGNITVTGDNVALLNGTIIDASGHTGLSGTTEGKEVSAHREGSAGGDIRIGGDYLGQGDTPTAKNLYVDQGALIVNDALFTGDAGRSIFWSDGTTQFYGNVYARALGGKPVDSLTWSATTGGNAGDGGFVETSGHEHLDAGGYVDLTASNGHRGTYFLDPTDITIYGNAVSVFNISMSAYWKLDDGTAISATDSSGNGINGTLINGPAWSDAVAPTPQNNAYSIEFDGINDQINSNVSLDTTANTVSFWVYLNGSSAKPSGQTLFRNTSGQSWRPYLYVSEKNGKLVVYSTVTASGDIGSFGNFVNTGNLSSGGWHLVTLVQTVSTQTVYIDGSQTFSRPFGTSSNNGGLQLGSVYWGVGSGNGDFLNGKMDDFRVYNTSLSANDIAELYGSRFTVAGIEQMSQTANVSIQASNSITLDLQGDTLALASDRNFSLTTTNGNISSVSAGTITTIRTASGGNITMTAGGTGAISLTNVGLNAQGGGLVSLSAGGGVSVTSSTSLNLGSVSGTSVLLRTTGATDITLNNTISASGSGTAITLAAGRNIINNAGGGALSAPSGRWLAYSTNPANDTPGGLTNGFRRFSCTYGGSCPTVPASGNGFLYSSTPLLTATPSVGFSVTYGDAAPNLSDYAYTLSGYLGSDSISDSVTGSLNGSTPYAAGSNVASYAINHASGSLASELGYGFTYASSATGLNVTPKTVTASLTGTVRKTFNGTAAAILTPANYLLPGVLAGDSVSLNNPTSGSFNNSEVGTGKLVTVTGLALLGADSGNYLLGSPVVSAAIGQIDSAAPALTPQEASRVILANVPHGVSVMKPSAPPVTVTDASSSPSSESFQDLSPMAGMSKRSLPGSNLQIDIDPALQWFFSLPPRL